MDDMVVAMLCGIKGYVFLWYVCIYLIVCMYIFILLAHPICLCLAMIVYYVLMGANDIASGSGEV